MWNKHYSFFLTQNLLSSLKTSLADPVPECTLGNLTKNTSKDKVLLCFLTFYFRINNSDMVKCQQAQ